MVLAFAIFIVSSSATQDMSKLETRFEETENFGFWGLSSRLRVQPPVGVLTRLPGPHRGRKRPLTESSAHWKTNFGVVFLFLIKHKRRYSANTKKPGNPHDSWTFSWSWKRDLNTRPVVVNKGNLHVPPSLHPPLLLPLLLSGTMILLYFITC